jgi:nucleoside-diphosphate-sugar epimerase
VLVAGASGLVGQAATRAFLDDGWRVVAFSRTRPDIDGEDRFTHVSVDLRDSDACARAVADVEDVTHLVYAAVYELPGIVGGWTTDDHIETNGAMLRNVVEPLSRTGRLRRTVLVHGSKAYGLHLGWRALPARERKPRREHPNFYFVQQDYISEKAAQAGFDWSIVRPGDIHGPGYGVSFNKLPVIGVYAAICEEAGLRFGFPGGALTIREATDVGLLSRAIRWAAEAPTASNEVFNVANGEIFTWRDVWPAIAETLGTEPGPDTPRKMAEFLPAHRDLWPRIVEKYRLKPLTIDQVLGQSHFMADSSFSFGATEMPVPPIMSTVKIKQAGFTEACDTELSICHWLNVLIEQRVIPKIS